MESYSSRNGDMDANNQHERVMQSPLLKKAFETMSGFNMSLADKLAETRADLKRHKALLHEQRILLRDTEAFVESILLDGKWEKRLICSALGRIIGGVRNNSLDRVAIIRQAAMIVNLIHNSIDNPVLYLLSDADEKDFVQTKPIETIASALQGKYETMELMQGFHRLTAQHQKILQQSTQLAATKSPKNGNNNLPNDSPIKAFINNHKDGDISADITLEKLIALLEDELGAQQTASNTNLMNSVDKVAPKDIDSFNASLASEVTKLRQENKTLREESIALRNQANKLSEEAAALRTENDNAAVDITALRDYATELQAHLESVQKSHGDSLYELRLACELAKLREHEAEDRLRVVQGSMQSKEEIARGFQSKIDELSIRYELLESSSKHAAEEHRRTLEESNKERASLVESLAQVSAHLNDLRREYGHFRAVADATAYELRGNLERLTAEKSELSMENALLKQKVSLANGSSQAHHQAPNPPASQVLVGSTADLSAQIRKLIGTLGESEEARKSLARENDSLNEKIGGYEALVIELEEKVAIQLQVISDLKSELSSQMEEAAARSPSKRVTFSDDVPDAQTAPASNATLSEEAATDEAMKVYVKKLVAAAKKTSGLLSATSSELKDAKARLADMAGALNELQARAKDLQKENDLLRSGI